MYSSLHKIIKALNEKVYTSLIPSDLYSCCANSYGLKWYSRWVSLLSMCGYFHPLSTLCNQLKSNWTVHSSSTSPQDLFEQKLPSVSAKNPWLEP